MSHLCLLSCFFLHLPLFDITHRPFPSPFPLSADSHAFSTGSIGVLIPNCESKIVDDHGEEVKDGEHGELLYRGPNTCLGYWRKSKTTAESFTADGWFKTGDIALHRNGWFWIVDRKKVRSNSVDLLT